ncbi:MAG: efflux RND transporter periplasmic adaptor subunit [Imperialibacter sp.]|uniref:efflux RND transporter periplasmic adaptor subunit n=1 Tax=Imperialibacter sp. TaxID=2038411 RepID=UPI0032EFB086
MRKLLPIVFLTVLVTLLGCRQQDADTSEKEQTFVLSDAMLKSTTTAKAVLEPLRNELRFYGKITTDNNKLIEVFPVVGGNVVKVYVELGDYVNKGQLLATIRSTEVAGFEKEMQDAKNDLLVALNNVKVAQELYEGKLVAERDVIEAKSQQEKAQSQLNRIEETYRIYNMKSGSIYEVVSPISGFVIEKNINQDMQLRSDRTDNIFDIAQIDDVWAIANVNESDINEVKLGVDAFVTTLSYKDKVFHGKVDKIFNIIDPATKAMKVRIKLANNDYMLKPEMRASIRVSYTEDMQMLAVPSNAVIFDKSKNFVVVFNDRFDLEVRQVETFRQLGDITYIAAGLKEGDRVVTHNQLLIYDALTD